MHATQTQYTIGRMSNHVEKGLDLNIQYGGSPLTRLKFYGKDK